MSILKLLKIKIASKIVLSSFLISSIVFLSSCDKDNTVAVNDPFADSVKTYTNLVINQVADSVILQTYINLHDKAVNLQLKLEVLKTIQNESALEDARQAWRETRHPWELSEGFLFGPVKSAGLDPAMDSWPVNVIDLDEVLSSPNALTPEYIDQLEGTVRGFHTIEYLLFGVNSNKKASEFTERQFEYLLSTGKNLEKVTKLLLEKWLPNGEDKYITKIKTAGEAGNSFYVSKSSVIQEFTNGMIGIADEVANGKINDPFSQEDIKLEESRFSANSKKDFADNIRSIKNVYMGSLTNHSDAKGISAIVKLYDKALDSKIQKEIDEAISSIESIPGTFTSAIFNNKAEVTNAQVKVRKLQETLESELKPLVIKIK